MQELLENGKKGLVFIVSAPAGTGKTTLVDRLAHEFPRVIRSISYTTRTPREGEVDGKDYHFIKNDEFERMVEKGLFLEYVKLYDYYYGTSKQWVNEQQKKGNHVVLVIDTQGALRLKGSIPAIYVFVRPPSLDELSRRLEKRKTETVEVQEQRLAWAKVELEAARYYDYQIVNDDLDVAYEVLKSIFIAESHRVNHEEKK